MIPVIWRRAIRIAVAVLIGVLGYEYFQLSYGFWTPLAILLVMQDTSGATLRRGCQRLMGLLFGVLLGSIIVWFLSSLLWRELLMVVMVVIVFSLRPKYLIQDNLLVIPLMLLFGMMLAILLPELNNTFILSRVLDVVIGTVIAIVVTLILFPATLQNQVEIGVPAIVKQGVFYAAALFALFDNNNKAEQRAQTQCQQFLHHLRDHRHYFQDWLYEFSFRRKHRRRYRRLIVLTEELSQILMSLHLLAQQKWSQPLRKEITTILYGIDDKVKHLVATVCLQTQDTPLVTEVDNFETELMEINTFYLIAFEKKDHHTVGLLSWLISDLENLGSVFQAMLRH